MTLRLALLAALLPSVAAAAEPVPLELGDGRTFLHDTLDNGLEVSVVSDPRLALVATQVWYHVGSANEDAGSRGLAHLFEHLMFGPTDVYEKDAVTHLHNRHGGENNAYTSFDETVYTSEVAAPYHLEVLSLEASRMRDLALTAEELANEQRIVTEELRLRTENDPLARVMVTALETILGDHPYALTPAGTKEDVAAATLESCTRFYERHYQPGRAHVVVAGPVDPRETLAAVRERFGTIPAAGRDEAEIPGVIDRSFPPETVLAEDLPPVETATLFFPMPPLDHPDAPALELLQTMITGAAEPFREDLVRKRGKALEAGVEVFWNRRGGGVGFYAAQLPYRRKATAFRQIEQSLGAIAAQLTEERLAAAKRRLLLGRQFGRYWASAQANALGSARWHLGSVEEAFRRDARIQDVTLDAVHRTWETYFEKREPVRLYLEPERVPIVVRLFGWLYPLLH